MNYRRTMFALLFFLIALPLSPCLAASGEDNAEKPKPAEPFLSESQMLTSQSPSDKSIQRAPTGIVAATLNVPGDYATIQAAVDVALSGDVIVVASGTYPEAITVNGKDLTIQGAGSGLSIITGTTAVTTHIVHITGSATVDFSGFTVDGTGKDIQYGVYADSGTDGDIHDNEIKNIAYPGAAGLAVRREDSQIYVTNNDIYGFGRIGIYTRDENILNNDTGVISGNTVTGLGGADPDRINYGISCYYGNPTITGNHIYDCLSGANQTNWASSGMDLWNGGTPSVTNNDIHNCGYGIMVGNSTVSLSGNTFFDIDGDDVRLDFIVKGNPTAHWAEWYDTIQEAVDAVPVSSYKSLVWIAIYSGAGTYEEQVEIDKSLRMYGNYSNTVIVSPETLTQFFTTSGDNYPIVYAHDADEVIIDGLVVDGAGRGNSNNNFIGVGYHNAGGYVNEVEFKDVKDTPFSGAQHGVAMYLYNEDSVAREFGLYSSTFTGFQKNAVALNASSTTELTVEVAGNVITGAGATDVTAQNGIQLYGEMITGTISGNEISGIAYDNTAAATKWCATSILNYLGDAEVTGNTITGAHMAIYHYFGRGPVRENDLTIEKIGVYAYGVVTADPPHLVPSPFSGEDGALGSSREIYSAAAADVNSTVNSNVIVFSGTDNTDTYGVSLEAGYDADNITAVADSNTVTGFGTGIEFWSCQSGCGTGLFASGDAHYNNISGNTMGMFSNVDYITVDATNNWWGHSSGPYHPTLNSDGLGDEVSDRILFDPFIEPGISVSPVYAVTTCSDPLTFTFLYDGTDVPKEVRGYEVTFTIDPAVVTVQDDGTDIVEGSFLDSFGDGSFYATDEGGGAYTANCAILGGDTGATGSGDLFSVELTPVAEGTSAITITGVKVRDLDNNDMSASTEGASVQVDCTVPTMETIAEAEGGWYNSAPVFSNFGFDDDVNLDVAEYQIDGGSWTTIFSGIDATEWNDDGWTLPGFSGLSEGSHTVYFRVADDAGNWNGESTPDTYSWQFNKDTTPPEPPTAFAAAPGNNKVHLSWTNPTGDATFVGVELRRAAWGDYPEYITAPNYPADETEGVLIAQTSAEAYDNSVTAGRDIYYYTGLSYDLAGNYSAYDADGSDRATSYWLGDVASPYDGYVNYTDLVDFSPAFGESDGDPGWNNECDFGPTYDNSSYGIPLPDDVVDFEDLMIFAMIYGKVDALGSTRLLAGTIPEPLESKVAFSLEKQDSDQNGTVLSLRIDNDAETLKGFSIHLSSGDGGRILSVQRGEIFEGGNDLFFGTMRTDNGSVEIDAAALGINLPISQSGEVARVVVSGGSASLKMLSADLRDLENRGTHVELEGEFEAPFMPTSNALMQNYPNPFNPVTSVTFDIVRAGRVNLRIFDVNGRLIKTLVDEIRTAGRHTIEWNGLNNRNESVPSGVYFYRIDSSGFSATRKMILLR